MTEVLIENQQIRNCANIADKNLKRQGFRKRWLGTTVSLA